MILLKLNQVEGLRSNTGLVDPAPRAANVFLMSRGDATKSETKSSGYQNQNQNSVSLATYFMGSGALRKVLRGRRAWH